VGAWGVHAYIHTYPHIHSHKHAYTHLLFCAGTCWLSARVVRCTRGGVGSTYIHTYIHTRTQSQTRIHTPLVLCRHSLALSTRGEVYAWGRGEYVHTYIHTHTQSQTRIHTPLVLCRHSLALSTRGEVYAWGRGEYGRLGTGDRSGSSKLRPQKVMRDACCVYGLLRLLSDARVHGRALFTDMCCISGAAPSYVRHPAVFDNTSNKCILNLAVFGNIAVRWGVRFVWVWRRVQP